ncbi:DUF6457 domain-containing protein [Georgenia sp. AZ-5]|uniref:DUF6457 domain-containing protein n=1 Tax=Georgenia sp. AZ-5 TaxID=3367526 RepID=UPI003754858A
MEVRRRGEGRGDETEKMAAMNRWLDAVCGELGVDRAVMDASTSRLLELIHDVAHGPSRPGAPLTAFLVGLAAGSAADDAAAPEVSEQVAERVAAVSRLVAVWDGEGRR